MTDRRVISCTNTVNQLAIVLSTVCIQFNLNGNQFNRKICQSVTKTELEDKSLTTMQAEDTLTTLTMHKLYCIGDAVANKKYKTLRVFFHFVRPP